MARKHSLNRVKRVTEEERCFWPHCVVLLCMFKQITFSKARYYCLVTVKVLAVNINKSTTVK